MPGTTMREVLLHGGMDEAFDRSVVFARQLAESFGARLHVIYTLEDPLAAGWTAEVSAERLPEVHQAIEDEARERLARSISARGPGAPRRAAGDPHSGPRTRKSSATPTNTRSTSPSSRSRRRATVDARARAHRAGPLRGARAAVIPSDLLLAAYASGWFPMAGRGGHDLVVFARSARHHPARHLPRPVAAAADAASDRGCRSEIDAAFEDGHARLRRGRARGRGRRHVDQRGDHRQLLRAARAGLRALGRGLATAIGWSAASTASRSAARSSASRCSTARPTRRRSRWSRWSSACARAASAARHPVGHAAPRAVRRDRDSRGRTT